MERPGERHLQLRHDDLALFLVGWCQKIGAKRVHAICLGFAAVSLVWLANISNQYVALSP